MNHILRAANPGAMTPAQMAELRRISREESAVTDCSRGEAQVRYQLASGGLISLDRWGCWATTRAGRDLL